MHLTRALQFFKRRTHIPGLMHTGKHKIVPTITEGMKKAAMRQAFLEKENLRILQKPYITEVQEYNHMRDMPNNPKRMMIIEERKLQKKMLPHRLMKDHLDHLNVTKKWE